MPSTSTTARREVLPIDHEEWVGGWLELPADVTSAAPYCARVIIWASAEGVLGAAALREGADGSDVGEHLLATMRKPAVGRARRPARIRVARPELRVGIAAVGAGIEVVIAPTPEIDAIAAEMFASLLGPLAPSEGQEPSYLDGGVPEARVRTFFEAASRLWRAAPWDIVPHDRKVLGVDVPALGARGRCLSVIGQGGESFGFILFESLRAQRAFVRAAEGGAPVRGYGCSTLAVSFNAAEDMPDRMVHEVAEHGWPLPEGGRYPSVMLLDADGAPRPQTHEDMSVAIALVIAVTRFFEKHTAWGAMVASPICERCDVPEADGVEVAITVPCPDPDRSRPAPPRNKKRKKERAPRAGTPRATTVTAIVRLVNELWGPEFAARFPEDLDDAYDQIELAVPTIAAEELGSLPRLWAALWRRTADGTGADAARGWSKLRPPVLAAALERMCTARVVYAEVRSIDRRAATATLHDLWDGTSYCVLFDESILGKLTRWTRCFTVLVELESGKWYPPTILVATPLLDEVAPAELIAGVRAAVANLGFDESEIDPAAPHATMLPFAAIAGAFVHLRLCEIEEERAAAPAPRRYCTTSDGERFEMHEARARLPSRARTALFAALCAHSEFVERDRESFARVDRTLTSVHPGGESIGEIEGQGGTLKISASSAGRFERLLVLLEQLAGARIEVFDVERIGPWQQNDTFVEEEGPGVERVVMASTLCVTTESPDPRRMVLDMMRAKLDHDIPELGRPRELVKTDEGKAAVTRWLREIEQRGQPGAGSGVAFIDMDPLRRELGLPPVSDDPTLT